MLPGYNHNLAHRGRHFHVQTEDSGPPRAQIVTQLFEGGNVVATKRQTYGDIVSAPDFEKSVRSRMQTQHKEMIRELVRGTYDEVHTGPVHHLQGPTPINLEVLSREEAAPVDEADLAGSETPDQKA